MMHAADPHAPTPLHARHGQREPEGGPGRLCHPTESTRRSREHQVEGEQEGEAAAPEEGSAPAEAVGESAER
eukprot:8088092-Pyramimonas_sp.AAC.1